MYQRKNTSESNSISMISNFDRNFINGGKPNLMYSKIYSSNTLLLPPLKKLFLGSILLYAGAKSYKQWKKYNKSTTINTNSTVYWNVNVFIIINNKIYYIIYKSKFIKNVIFIYINTLIENRH